MEYMYKDLVEGARDGCERSMETLIDKLKPLIYSAIGRHKRGGDVEELYQEACILIIEAVREFDEARGVPFLAFAKSRMYYGIYNITRKSPNELSLDESLWDEDGQTMLDMLEDTGPRIEDEVVQEDIYTSLRNAIKGLTHKQREVIVAHYFEGRRFKDIARAKDLHYKTILRLKDRGISGLYGQLKNLK